MNDWEEEREGRSYICMFTCANVHETIVSKMNARRNGKRAELLTSPAAFLSSSPNTAQPNPATWSS